MLRETEIRIGLRPAIEGTENDEIFVTEQVPFDLVLDLNDWIQFAFLPLEGTDRGEILFKPRRRDEREQDRVKLEGLAVTMQTRDDKNGDEFFISEKLGYNFTCNLRDTACVLRIPAKGDGTLTFTPRAAAPKYEQPKPELEKRVSREINHASDRRMAQNLETGQRAGPRV